MGPETDAVQRWTSLYVLVVWVYIVYVAVNPGASREGTARRAA